ncbi:MAG TPA: hypothetical protein VKP60_16605 [Magnetospirillaceae bacterium]|nr:hypothetical protein [Magnetospirillaceae bacterium]
MKALIWPDTKSPLDSLREAATQSLAGLMRAIRPAHGPAPPTGADRLARGLAYLSFGAGLAELLWPWRFTHMLGLRGKEGLVRAYGARGIAAGILTLFNDRAGLIARLLGGGLDLAALTPALGRRNRKRDNAAAAAAVVGTILLLDVLVAIGSPRRRAKRRR